jgi:hypothetical protein
MLDEDSGCGEVLERPPIALAEQDHPALSLGPDDAAFLEEVARSIDGAPELVEAQWPKANRLREIAAKHLGDGGATEAELRAALEEAEDRFESCDNCERPSREEDLKVIWGREAESGELVDARICLVCRLEAARDSGDGGQGEATKATREELRKAVQQGEEEAETRLYAFFNDDEFPEAQVRAKLGEMSRRAETAEQAVALVRRRAERLRSAAQEGSDADVEDLELLLDDLASTQSVPSHLSEEGLISTEDLRVATDQAHDGEVLPDPQSAGFEENAIRDYFQSYPNFAVPIGLEGNEPVHAGSLMAGLAIGAVAARSALSASSETPQGETHNAK